VPRWLFRRTERAFSNNSIAASASACARWSDQESKNGVAFGARREGERGGGSCLGGR